MVLGDVVGGAQLEHLDRGLLADGAGDGDDRHAGPGGEQLAQRRPGVPARQRVVEEGHVPLAAVEGRGELRLRRHARRLDAVAGAREAELLELGVLLAVVDAQKAQRRPRRHAGVVAVPHCCRPRRGLVEQGPERADLPHGVDELVEVDRLDHVGVGAEVVGGLQVRPLARDHHAVGEVVLAQRLERELHVARVVFGQQDSAQIDVHQCFLPTWQAEEERCARIFCRFGPATAAVAADDPVHVGEADARALELIRAVQPLEHAEQPVGISP